MHYLRLILLCIFAMFQTAGCAIVRGNFTGAVSPFDYGLRSAKTGEQRYDVLYRTHCAAIERGVNVDYSGVGEVELSIPKNAKPVPLTDYTDFKGTRFVLHNFTKTAFVFELSQPISKVNVSARDVDRGNFSAYPELRNGKKVLMMDDKNPWVVERKGYGQAMIRNDILLVENGKAKNTVVYGYDNLASKVECHYFNYKSGQRVIKNVVFMRDSTSTFIPNCIKVKYVNDLLIENIKVHTQPNALYSDHAIHVLHGVNIKFKDVLIDKTFSQTKQHGYGIALHNLWNCEFENLIGYGNWGVFGSNNLSNIRFKDCSINRFDIHSYGKDIYFRSCKFFDLYNQFSSMAGIVYFEDCEFTNFTPVLIESSYNAFTTFTVEMVNCTFNTTASKNYMIEAGRFDEERNTRPELLRRYWPRLKVSNLTVNCPQDVKSFYFYRGRVPNENGVFIDDIDDVAVDGLTINNEKGQNVNLYMSKYKVKTRRRGAVAMEGLRFAGETKATGGTSKRIIDNITRTE